MPTDRAVGVHHVRHSGLLGRWRILEKPELVRSGQKKLDGTPARQDVRTPSQEARRGQFDPQKVRVSPAAGDAPNVNAIHTTNTHKIAGRVPERRTAPAITDARGAANRGNTCRHGSPQTVSADLEESHQGGGAVTIGDVVR